MTEKLLKELEADLLQYEQAYAFGDIDKEEYTRNKTRLTAQIAERKLLLKKQEAGRALDKLYYRKEISQNAYSVALGNVARAKSEAEIQVFHFKTAA